MSYTGFMFNTDTSYLAKPRGLLYWESPKNSTPAFKVMFAVETDDGPKDLEWTGYLTPAAKKRTAEIMINILGWNKKMDTDANGVFPEDALNKDAQVKVTVKYNDQGYPEVQWVNSLGGSKFANAKPVEARKGMQMLGLDALVLEIEREGGYKAPPAKPQQQSQPQTKKIPF